jgi:uncharacterized protein
VAFVRQPDIAAKYGIDTHRIVLGGHSMGGFATAAHTRADDHLLGAVLLDSWNAGATGDELGKESPAELEKSAPARFDDLGNSLHGATPLSTAKEVIAHRVDWNYLSWAKSLTHCPMLIVGASKAGGEQNRKLAEAVTAAGGKVTASTLQSDHSFQDHRIALAGIVVDWLDTLPKN